MYWDVTASKEWIEAIREAQGISNLSPAVLSCKSDSTEGVISLPVDHELDVGKPPTKSLGLRLSTLRV